MSARAVTGRALTVPGQQGWGRSGRGRYSGQDRQPRERPACGLPASPSPSAESRPRN